MVQQTNSNVSAPGTEQQAPRRISPEQMAALFRSAAFGDVVGVLMRAPKHKTMSLEALRTYVLPAIVNSQFMIAQLRQQDGKGASAAGVALWANVSDEIDKRFRANPDERLKLGYDEWKSGTNLWLIDLIAPSQLVPSILNDLETKVAKGQPMAARVVSKEGTTSISTLQNLIKTTKNELSMKQ